MKLIITLALVYIAYRLFFAKPAIPGAGSRNNDLRAEPPPPVSQNRKHEGEYIDYEEVD